MHWPWTPDFFASNRSRFLRALKGDAALLFGSPHHIRNGDVEFRYRPASDLFYLTGWTGPDVALFLRPGAEQVFTLFVQPKNPEMEMWTGIRPGPEGAVHGHGADAAFAIDELWERVPAMIQGYDTLHYRFAQDAERDRLLSGAINKAARQARRNGLQVPHTFVDPARVLHEMRVIKRDEEVTVLRKASEITAEAHLRAMAMTKAGTFEYQLEAEIEGTFRRLGGCGPGYGSIVAGGVNATVLHYQSNDEALQEGDLVCVDAGCEYGFYTADVTRTWPVSGQFNPAQRRLYEIVLEAQVAAIDKARSGVPYAAMHEAATRVLTEGMVQLGLLDGDVDELIAEGKQKRFYPHGTGHWLGLDVHDAGAYHLGGESRALEPGMVLTVEPGLYIPRDAEDVAEEYRGIGIRIEDDVLVTDQDPDVLTDMIPKEVADVEETVRSGRA